MNLTGFIASRYFFSKSSRNAINIISAISILGILVGTLALILVLSAFNGLENLVGGFYGSFDPDLKIAPKTGKHLSLNEADLENINNLEGVLNISQVLEERVLLSYQDKEHIATIKGVDQNYEVVTRINSTISHGSFDLQPKNGVNGLVMGAGVRYYLGYGTDFFLDPIQIFVPKSTEAKLDFNQAFSSELAYPTGIFSVQPEFDVKYAIVDLEFVRSLLNTPGATSFLELSLEQNADSKRVKQQLATILGDEVTVKDRIEQQEVFMKVMRSESLFTFLVFTLILAIASFTIMGSLSMMMIDKKHQLRTLWALGTELPQLRRIFFKEGMLISGTGAILGLILGVLAVIGQEQFGWVQLGQGYVVEAYPMELRFRDVILVICTVSVLGGLSSWLTSRRLSYAFLQSAHD